MSSEEVSLIAGDRFIQKFVYAIIQNIRAKNFAYEERHVIHAEMVPRVSEKVMQASLVEKRVTPEVVVAPVAPPVVVPRRRMPKRRGVGVRGVGVSGIRNTMQRPMMQLPQVPQGVGLSQDYGKITPLLNDPSVSVLECLGVGKPLMIVRAGQKMSTKISLNAKEIKEILGKVSDVVHIPLLEGVFRAAVDNFSISAVVSEMIGSRFVIKKQTPYSSIE